MHVLLLIGALRCVRDTFWELKSILRVAILFYLDENDPA
jgi:hypothetical protein